MTNKELGQKARAEIKAAGINLKELSVTTQYAGYEQCLTVKAKTDTVDIKKVAQIVRKYKAVDYCPVTQEILSGGNVYVSVQGFDGYGVDLWWDADYKIYGGQING